MDGLAYHQSALGEWLTTQNGRADERMRWRKESSGHRIEATEDIPAEQTIVSLPYDSAIAPALVRQHLAASDVTKLSDHQVLVLYLVLHDIALEQDDKDFPIYLKHREYVRTLPRPHQMSTALWYNQAERKLLAGSNLGPAVEQREQEWKAERKAVLQFGVSITGLTTDAVSWERYLWASSIISSRAFPSYLLDGDRPNATQVLLPCVDAFNHRTGQAVTWFSNHQERTINLVTGAPIQAGQEICNNYGAKPNDELLLGYGFALPDNPGEFVSLKLGSAGDPGPSKILSALKLPLTKMHYIRRDAEELPGDLLAQLRVLVAEEDELQTLQAKVSANGDKGKEVPDDTWQDVLHFLSWPNELEMLGQLGDMLQMKADILEKALEVVKQSKDEERPAKRSKSDPPLSSDDLVRPQIRSLILIYLQGQVEVMQACLTLHENLYERTVERAKADGFEMESSSEESDSDE